MKNKCRIITILQVSLLTASLMLSLFGCGAPETGSLTEKTDDPIAEITETGPENAEQRTEDIIILYTNDIHSAIDENIGLAGVAAYKQKMQQETPFVTLVDCGDSIQGSYLSAASQGLVIIDAMNEVGYDYRILGNHEFDYRLSGVKNIIDESKALYLNCNIVYTGSGTDIFEKTSPYAIKDYGETKIGFVGVTTPNTVSSSTPSYFKDPDGNYIVRFDGADPDGFYHCVQRAVDECRSKGADYVVVLGHLGNYEEEGEYRSTELIAHTTGIDVLLDAHSHAVIDCETVCDLKGKPVILSSTGTALEHIGKLTIAPDGTITTENITDFEEKDADITAWIENAQNVYEGFLGETLFTLGQTLPISDEDGIRMVRTREMGLGNFCADALRYSMDAEIGMINGGGVRAALEAGEVSTLDLIKITPFGNEICSMKITGAEILDMLEYFYRDVQGEYRKDGGAVGENGSFMHLSGMKVVIDTSVPSSVEVDGEDNLIAVGDTRRVTEALVLQNGEYVPVDPEKTYLVALQDYMAVNGGCGMAVALSDNELVTSPSVSDYETLISYARDALGYDLSAYFETENRITVQ